MSEREAALAEAYRRGIMNPEQKSAYEEAMRRGLVDGPRRSLGERFMDNFRDGRSNSIRGWAERSLDRNGDGIDMRDLIGPAFFDIGDLGPRITEGSAPDRFLDRNFGNDRRLLPGRAPTPQVTQERDRRQSYARRAETDPIRNPLDFAAFLGGQVLGGGMSPENVIAPGRNFVTRALAAGGIGAGADVAIQGGAISEGSQDRYSLMQTAGAALLNGGLSLTADAIRPTADFVRRAFTDRVEPTVRPVASPRVDTGATEGIEVGLPDGSVVDVPRTPTGEAPAETPAMPAPVDDMNIIVPLERRGMIEGANRAVQERRVMRSVGDFLAKTYTAVIDARHPLARLRNEMQGALESATGRPVDIRPGEDPVKLARAGFDAYNIGMQDLLHGVHGYRQTAPSSPALADVMTAVTARETRLGGKPQKALEAFDQYLVARRAVIEWDRFDRGEMERPPIARTREQAEAFVARMDAEQPQMRELSDQVNLYAEGLLKKRLDAGLISRETYDAALANRDFYVPLRRLMDDRAPGVSTGAGRNGGPEVKRFRGSQRDVLSPMEVLTQDTLRLNQRIRQNDINRSIVAMAERLDSILPEGANPFMRKVDDPFYKVTISNERLAAQAEVPQSTIDDLFDDGADKWVAGQINDRGRPIIYVWKNGEREAWELIDEDWARETYEAITAMTPQQSDVLGSIIGAITTFTARTVTTTPDFILANLIRDQVATAGYVRGFLPGEGIRGTVDETVARATGQMSEAGRLYNIAGGISGGATTAQMSEMLLRQDALELTKRGWKARYFSDGRGFLRWIGDVARWTEVTEVGNRRTAFQKVAARMKKAGFDDYDALIEAAFASRDIIDFGRKGSRLHGAVRVLMFLNPYLQGLDKLVRTAIADPASAVGRAHASGGAPAAVKAMIEPLFNRNPATMRAADAESIRAAARLWTTMSIIGTFGLTLSAMFMDDPEYQQANEQTRATHWIVPVGDNIVKIPKPFEMAWMSNVLERWYEAVNATTEDDAEVAWSRLWSGVGDLFAPPTSVPLLAGITGVTTGVDPRTGRPIVGQALEDLPPEQQFNTWTSNFAIWLGQGTGWSPAMIDYVIQTFGGPVGTYALAAGDAADPDRPSGSWLDAPVVRRFVNPAFRGSQDKRDFYDRAGARTSELARAINGVENLVEMGQLGAAQRDLDALDRSGRLYVLSQLGEAKVKRLHPLSRARVVGTEASRMIGELNGALPKDEGIPLPTMSRNMRQMVEDAVERIAVAEMRNAMILSDQPGFQGRALEDRDALWDELSTLSPVVADELARRIGTGRDKAYDYQAIVELWPQASERLTAEGASAMLDDLADDAAGRSQAWENPEDVDVEDMVRRLSF